MCALKCKKEGNKNGSMTRGCSRSLDDVRVLYVLRRDTVMEWEYEVCFYDGKAFCWCLFSSL